MRPLRPLLSKKIEWKLEEEHETSFQEIKRAIQKITEIKYFKKTSQCGSSVTTAKKVFGPASSRSVKNVGRRHTLRHDFYNL